MSDITATCDPTAVREALHKAAPAVAQRTDQVDHETADRVAGDARARVPRRTGATAATIEVLKNRRVDGYLVIVRGAALYLEFGTLYMAARAFFYPSARLEAPGYDRRTRDAVQDGIAVVGLGA
jgi:hypothetical protein